MKRALITGITGQDGSYLADFLLEKGYEVHGVVRRTSTHNRERIDHLSEPGTYTSTNPKGKFYLYYADMTDSSSMEEILRKVMPDEIYNLAAQSHVRVSFEVPENTVNIVALGTLRILEGIKKICPKARFYQAGSSEMFGKVRETPQNENTPFYPRSPYGRAKVFAHWETIGAREAYGLHASNGILFNHESERRSPAFVSRKITRALTRIKMGLQKKISFGNLEAERDWGHAKDYVKSMWLILQQDEPGDYVIGTSEKHSVREFLEETAKVLGMNIKSNGLPGLDEKYLDENGNVVVEMDSYYLRPTEVDTLMAEYSKAKEKLGWEPTIKFKELVRIMAEHDLKLAEEEAYLKSIRHIKSQREAMSVAQDTSSDKNPTTEEVTNNPNVKIHPITYCRICGNSNLIPIISLGSQPLSGRFPAPEESEPLTTPLELVKCDDHNNANACGLLQLKHTVDLGEMYGETYGYRSGLNKTMTNHLTKTAQIIEQMIELYPGDVVLDIGSSDATLLKAFTKTGIKRLGIDPAAKKYSEFYPMDIDLIADFFSAEKYRSKYPDTKAKVISTIAMFYDLQEPMKFVKQIKEVLHPEGIWVCEQSYMPKMLEVNAFDTICQEHLEYYSLKQIEWMLEKNDLKVFDIEFNDINGASFKVYICHKENPRNVNKEQIEKARQHEKDLELETLKPYNDFKERVEAIKSELIPFMKSEKEFGRKTHIYGASTKGNVLLHYFGIGKDLVDVAAEINPDKYGKTTPGTRIPIVSVAESRAANPDYYFVLPWHFKEEFLKKEIEFLKQGGKFIFPLPNFEVVDISKVEAENLQQPL